MLLSNPLSFTNPIPNPNPNFPPSQPPSLPRRRFRLRCRRGGGDRRWDSNAESFRFRFRDEEDDEGGKSNGGRRWWSDEDVDDFDDEFDFFEEDSESFWDKFWIFKVFKAYGYLLPAIIGSMLLATGPKAFLMALALPLGQSAISLAIEKLWGGVSEEPRTKPKTKRTKPKTKRKPFTKSSTNFRNQEKEERKNGDKGRRNGYQSWVSADSGVEDSVRNSTRSSFGGWDELDSEKGPMRRDPPITADNVNRGKLSKRRRYKDAPLFLRLLIAVFPFLGSWTRIL